MSLLKIPADTAPIRVLLGASVLLIVGLTFIAAKWAIGNALATRSPEKEVTDLGASLAVSDPLARFAHAAILERAFNMDAIAASLAEYEAAAALSPNDYRLWLGLGRARERDGDRAGAEQAYRHAAELAPHYSRVHWALGNLLVRDGRGDEGFAHIRRAAETDTSFAAPAVRTAWQAFEGDVARVTIALGDGENTKAELAKSLAAQKRLDEAVAVWNSIPSERRRNAFGEQGKFLEQKATENGRFRLALAISNESAESPSRINAVTNGGFEQPIKPKSSGPFDWKNIDGAYPQMGPTNGQKAAGEVSLLVRFGDPTNLEFRPLSQTIAVEPGRRYSLSLSHRSEIKSQAAFRWEVVAGPNGGRLAATEPLAVTRDWTISTVEFQVPDDTDAITIRLIRENCPAPICTVSGALWFDEFVLKQL